VTDFAGQAHRAGTAMIVPVPFPARLAAPRPKAALAGLSARHADGGKSR